ncbi:MAG: dephospho-CoA kinase [Clostridiales Family XIII bacterium]|jgi:dephospho-CoA kinase|nr:dephospho-CoA kinase [Clostridiales Family XIII bacterium]
MNSSRGDRNATSDLKIIGITGGIGSGKSLVTTYLRSLNYTVYDADEIAKEAVRPGEPVLERLREAFGPEILNAESGLDRQALADLVFGNEKNVEMMNGIMHGDVISRIDSALCRSRQQLTQTAGSGEVKNNTVFLSAPLLLEVGLDDRCDEVWLITADEEIRVQRAATRDNVPPEKIRDRIRHQMRDSEKSEKADVIIKNNESPAALYAQIDNLLMIVDDHHYHPSDG